MNSKLRIDQNNIKFIATATTTTTSSSSGNSNSSSSNRVSRSSSFPPTYLSYSMQTPVTTDNNNNNNNNNNTLSSLLAGKSSNNNNNNNSVDQQAEVSSGGEISMTTTHNRSNSTIMIDTSTIQKEGNNNNINNISNLSSHSYAEDENDMKPLLVESGNSHIGSISRSNSGEGSSSSSSSSSSHDVSLLDKLMQKYCASNPEFFKNAFKLSFAFLGLQISYLTWGYMQELIMTSTFKPTPTSPTGRFPSAAFCVFSNRFLAVIIALIAVRLRHGAFFANNKAPLLSFTPCAFSNTMSSWSQYASLRYVSFPVQTVFKSSKIIPVMIMGKVLKGTVYPASQYIEAVLITIGVALFSILSKETSGETTTEIIGLVFLIMYVFFDSFTSQWQDKVYHQYGKQNVDPYQMMLGVNVSAICLTSAGLLISNDLPKVYEFLLMNPQVLTYNIITAITSASGQLCIFYTIKEFGPIVFTIIMTTRQMLSICLSAIIFGHKIKYGAATGAILVFGVLFYQIHNKFKSKNKK